MENNQIDIEALEAMSDKEFTSFIWKCNQGDEQALKTVHALEDAARSGDEQAAAFLNKCNSFTEYVGRKTSEKLAREIAEGDPEGTETWSEIVGRFGTGSQTLADENFILIATRPTEDGVDLLLNDILGGQDEARDFLENLTPTKVKKALPKREVNPQEAEALRYTEHELAALRKGSDEAKAEARKARRERSRHFLSGLTVEECLKIAKKHASKEQQPEDVPSANNNQKVKNYVTTKDRLTKAVFGEVMNANGDLLSIVSRNPGTLTLWTSGKGNNRKEVAIYTSLEMNEKALKEVGITAGRNLSKCAREVYNAMLSYYLSGYKLLTVKMLAKIIFNVSDSATLTAKQEKYITNGVNEVFLTTIYVDTVVKADGYKNLSEECNINLRSTDQIFPGRFTEACINGAHVDNAIMLRDTPILYNLQKQLKKGHIMRVPAELLAIEGRTDEDLVTIRSYLLRRIDAMKHADLSRMIIFKNILEEVGRDPTDRKQRNKPKKTLARVERVLNSWTAKGYIKGYRKLSVAGNPINDDTAKLHEIEIII